MADRVIILAENGRSSHRGIKQLGGSSWLAYHREDDDLTYVIDYTHFFGSETVSSVARTASGTTVAGTAATTTRATQRLSGFGYVDITATSSGGQDRVDRIYIVPRSEDRRAFNDYE